MALRIRRDRLNKWLGALRSGAFEQGRQTLRTSADEFCCLGLVCEIANRAGAVRLVRRIGFEYTYDQRMTSPPDTVWKWLGVDISGVTVDIYNFVNHCIAMNDDEHKTFAEIADWIEANVEAYDA